MEHTEDATPGEVRSSEWLGLVAKAAGMANYLNYGAASHVSSEGCHGVTQDHLEKFAELVRAKAWQQGYTSGYNDGLQDGART